MPRYVLLFEIASQICVYNVSPNSSPPPTNLDFPSPLQCSYGKAYNIEKELITRMDEFQAIAEEKLHRDAISYVRMNVQKSGKKAQETIVHLQEQVTKWKDKFNTMQRDPTEGEVRAILDLKDELEACEEKFQRCSTMTLHADNVALEARTHTFHLEGELKNAQDKIAEQEALLGQYKNLEKELAVAKAAAEAKLKEATACQNKVRKAESAAKNIKGQTSELEEELKRLQGAWLPHWIESSAVGATAAKTIASVAPVVALGKAKAVEATNVASRKLKEIGIDIPALLASPSVVSAKATVASTAKTSIAHINTVVSELESLLVKAIGNVPVVKPLSIKPLSTYVVYVALFGPILLVVFPLLGAVLSPSKSKVAKKLKKRSTGGAGAGNGGGVANGGGAAAKAKKRVA